jgi:hypothetical protein
LGDDIAVLLNAPAKPVRETEGAIVRYLLPPGTAPIRYGVSLRSPDRGAFADVLFMQHRFFAVTDDDGMFRLPGLPDGGYVVVAGSGPFKTIERNVTINGRDPKPLSFLFEVPRWLLEPPAAVPRTKLQRADFVRHLEEQGSEFIRRVVYGDLKERYSKKIPAALTAAQRRQVDGLLQRLLDAEFVSRTARHEALKHYVRGGGDLTVRQTPVGHHGAFGGVSAGVSDESIWGKGVRGAEVSYFLDYAVYPTLEALRAARHEAENQLTKCVRELAK